mmetsp:Transcript_6339/g.12926  ORF Transcript_6339/g.12926 Transcript_6339/m.12926 type:complete len:747 (-) Transcript_6339:82-2322(-)
MSTVLQEAADRGRTPRDGVGTSEYLGKLVGELQNEGVLIPGAGSRHLRQLLREEAWRRGEAMSAAGNRVSARPFDYEEHEQSSEEEQQQQPSPPQQMQQWSSGATGLSGSLGATEVAGVELRPALLTQLVEEVLEYCRILLLSPQVAASVDGPGSGGGGSKEAASRAPSLSASPAARAGVAGAREVRLTRLRERCAETYALILLQNPEAGGPPPAAVWLVGPPSGGPVGTERPSAGHRCRVVVNHISGEKEVAVCVRKDATMLEVKEELARRLGRPGIMVTAQMLSRARDGSVIPFKDSDHIGTKRLILVKDADLSPEKGSPEFMKEQQEVEAELKEAILRGDIPQLRQAIERARKRVRPGALGTAGDLGENIEVARRRLEELEVEEKEGGGGERGGGEKGFAVGRPSEDPNERSGGRHSIKVVSSSPRKPSPPSPRNRQPPTPFFEALYALVTRAAQQGLRHAAGTGQDKALAARVEEELAQLFRTNEFGRGAAKRRGGAKVALTGSVEKDSAHGAACAEERLQKLKQKALQLQTRLNQDFSQLEARFFKNREKDDGYKQSLEADKPAAVAGDSKDAMAGAGDSAAISQGHVDMLIAGFKSRAPPHTMRRSADESASMQHVSMARSPFMASLLPSAHDKVVTVGEVARSRGRDLNLGSTSAMSPQSVAARSLLSGPNTATASKATLASEWTVTARSSKIEPLTPRGMLLSEGASLVNTWALTPHRSIHSPRHGAFSLLAASPTPR